MAFRQQAPRSLPPELAYYDALATNSSTKEPLGDAALCQMAKELAEKLRSNFSIDCDSKP